MTTDFPTLFMKRRLKSFREIRKIKFKKFIKFFITPFLAILNKVLNHFFAYKKIGLVCEEVIKVVVNLKPET